MTTPLVHARSLTSFAVVCFILLLVSIVGHEEEFFSLHFTDGRTLDLHSSAPIAREEWLRRFNALLHIVPFANWHHARGNVDQRKCLQLETDRCAGGGAAARIAKRYIPISLLFVAPLISSSITHNRVSTPTSAAAPSTSSPRGSTSSGVERKMNAEDSSEAQRIKGKYARIRD